eukprot:TRINITY_DN16575_c0_g1_i3.p2 TRINITY_DN16575_c0_g1~~TRINITY_DN16575_c0_g1_i3.p2  ORF type:complete len:204 (+),score=37.02 TRINITY_DN16575_c0_g1_i3:181-792(+)
MCIRDSINAEYMGQLGDYKKINSELDDMEKDPLNLYYISSNVNFPKEGVNTTEGMCSYGGIINRNGKQMRKIDIELANVPFPMSNMAHEFKHAYQYFVGDLIFRNGSKGGYDSRELERGAFERGNRFHGGTLVNGQNPDFKYKYDNFLPEKYLSVNFPETEISIANRQTPVSYTHLTLPTICSVQISVVAVSLKKKNKHRGRR